MRPVLWTASEQQTVRRALSMVLPVLWTMPVPAMTPELETTPVLATKPELPTTPPTTPPMKYPPHATMPPTMGIHKVSICRKMVMKVMGSPLVVMVGRKVKQGVILPREGFGAVLGHLSNNSVQMAQLTEALMTREGYT